MQLIISHHVLPAELQKVAECYEKTLLYSLWDGRPITNEISAVICRTSAIDIELLRKRYYETDSIWLRDYAYKKQNNDTHCIHYYLQLTISIGWDS
jgi:hypothetical protein